MRNFSLIIKKEFSALSDAAGPEKQGTYLPRPYYYKEVEQKVR